MGSSTSRPSPLQPPGAAEQLLKMYYYTELLGYEPFARDLLAVSQALVELWRRTRTRTGPGPGCGARMDDPGWHSLGGSGLLALARADGRAARDETGFAETCGAWAKAWAQVPAPLDVFAEQAARAWLRLGAGHIAQATTFLAERARALACWGERTVIGAFVGKWPLPADAEQDIATSFAVWHQLGRPGAPILLPAPLAADVPGEALVAVQRLVAGLAASPLGVLAGGGERLVAAADRLLRHLGWTRPAPHDRRVEMLRRRAGRLYRRLVLGYTYDRIADEEDPPPGADAVAKTTRRDARLLGIP